MYIINLIISDLYDNIFKLELFYQEQCVLDLLFMNNNI